MHLRMFVVGLILLLAPDLYADDYGIGFAAGKVPVISVQQRDRNSQANHFRLHYSDEQLLLGYDFQKFFGHQVNLFSAAFDIYSGFGVTGEALKSDSTKEYFFGRIPLGLQWDDKSLRMSAFIEAAGAVGPVPKTALTGEAAGGIRTIF